MDELAVVYVRRVLMFFPHADNRNQRQGWMLAQRVIGDSPRDRVYQLMKMSGQVLVGLASVGLAERLFEEGLTIGTTLLKVFPYRQRPEKIIVGNLPLAIKDEDVVATLRPYCRVVSLTHELRRTTKESVTFVRNTRQQQALNKARSSAATFDQCCYIEWCADFHPVHYMKALEELLGKESVYQLMKMSGHVMVGLASIEKAERLVENGLTINNTFLRAFPYRRKAEKSSSRTFSSQ
ncbi:hypothetical protein LAZ67_17000506 [Cordylochernes scorpioides]|uniref:Uncharacterized protein n=1 Tax=Cordylochernes scorpioides TaxID=51811 RepID=A0ABY6LFH2_9ARAC|nr:hypothetical protein LAZ67_17000506 [Cordylochernes scorpioides]